MNRTENDMETLVVRFGTVRPVSFREFDESYKYTDLVVVARMAGTVSVTDYDKERYKDDDEVTAAIKGNATELMQKSLDDMPAGKSIVKNYKSVLAAQFATELSKIGITATAEINLFSLLPESEEKLSNMMKLEEAAEKVAIKTNATIPGEDADAGREPGTFRVNYAPEGMRFGFTSAKKYYAPGDDVEVICRGIPGDTKCFFFANAESYKVQYEEGSLARIIFVMPDHDVDVLVTMDKQRFGPEAYEERDPQQGFMNVAGELARAKTGDAGTWDCIYCGSKNNTGPFCPDCGRPGYSEWTCPSCMFRNKGGGTCLSCKKPRLPNGFLG